MKAVFTELCKVPIVVFLVLLVLKTTGVLFWSWWWIVTPLWVYSGLSLLVYAFIGYRFCRLTRNAGGIDEMIAKLMAARRG